MEDKAIKDLIKYCILHFYELKWEYIDTYAYKWHTKFNIDGVNIDLWDGILS